MQARRRGAELRPVSRWAGPEQVWNERSQRFYTVRRGDKHDHGNRKVSQVLLEFYVLVSREEDIELLGGESEEEPVSLAGPSHLSDRADLVVRDKPA